jgi:hypothetical protein
MLSKVTAAAGTPRVLTRSAAAFAVASDGSGVGVAVGAGIGVAAGMAVGRGVGLGPGEDPGDGAADIGGDTVVGIAVGVAVGIVTGVAVGTVTAVDSVFCAHAAPAISAAAPKITVRNRARNFVSCKRDRSDRFSVRACQEASPPGRPPFHG